jgi:diguanylate cyclase (GGDEF)-like protein
MALTPQDHDLRIDSPWAIGERSGLLLLIALVPAILVLDFVAGRGISLHLFYLVPVALAAWNLGERTGYAIAGVSATAWAFVAVASRGPADSPAIVAWDILSTLSLFVFVAFLVARHRGFVGGLRALARVDAETGALTRREFDRVLEAEVRRAKRYRRHLALVLLDLAEIKGEGRGQLAAVARAVHSLVREGDGVARAGPRRLAIILIECRAPEPMLVVDRLREALVSTLRYRDQDLSIAVATYGGGVPTSGSSVMAQAEGHLQLSRRGAGIAETRID